MKKKPAGYCFHMVCELFMCSGYIVTMLFSSYIFYHDFPYEARFGTRYMIGRNIQYNKTIFVIIYNFFHIH